MPHHRLITMAEVTKRAGLRRTAIYARVAEGTFPPQVKIGTSSRWVESEIDAWIDEQIARRDGVLATTRAGN